MCDDNIWPQVTNYLVSDKQNLNTCPTMLKPRANSNNLAYKKGRINRQYPSFLKSLLSLLIYTDRIVQVQKYLHDYNHWNNCGDFRLIWWKLYNTMIWSSVDLLLNFDICWRPVWLPKANNIHILSTVFLNSSTPVVKLLYSIVNSQLLCHIRWTLT